MPQTYSQKPKRRSPAQQNSLHLASKAQDQHFQDKYNKENIFEDLSINTELKTLRNTVQKLQDKAQNQYLKYHMERRKNSHLLATKESYKAKWIQSKTEKINLQADLSHTTGQLQNTNNLANSTICNLRQKLGSCVEDKAKIQHENKILKARYKHAVIAKRLPKKHLSENLRNKPTQF